MEMMKAHKYNVEHRLKYDNQERILYRHHFNYYPVKRPRPRKTSLEPNWYTENIYSNQSIDNSDGEHAGMGGGAGGGGGGVAFPIAGTPGHRIGPASVSASATRDINGNLSMAGLEDDGGIFTIDGHLERRHPGGYPKSSSCCFATNSRMWDIEEGDGLELDEWNERYPKIPKSYSFSTSRSMGTGFNMAKLYNRNSFEMPEFPSQRRHRQQQQQQQQQQQLAGFDRSIVRMCDREGCFNETCFTSKDEKNLFNNNNQNHQQQHHHHHRNHLLQQHNNNNNSNNVINNNTSNVGNNHSSNLISEWNLRNRNNMRVRGSAPEDGPRSQYVMEEDFDLFDDDDDDGEEEDEEEEGEDDGAERDGIVEGEEEESDLNTLYADDRHSIAYGDYGRVARDFCARTPRHRLQDDDDDDDLFRTTFARSKQVRSRSQLLSDRSDDYRKSLEDFFNQNCCIEQQLHHRQRQHQQQQQLLLRDRDRFLAGSASGKPPKTKSMLEVKPPNRFDDTSSDSTDRELEDFNFDFEKYWEELEKPSPTSPSELEERYGVDGGRSAAPRVGHHNHPHHQGKGKVKNVNLNRCYNNGTVIDIYHDDDPYHRDHYHYREGGLHGARSVKAHNVHINNNNNVHRVHQQQHHHQANTTPRSKGSRHKVYPSSSSDGPRLVGLADEGDGGGGGGGQGKQGQPGPAANAISNNSNAISFLNNIFSIYKPNKYSPLNCHVEQNYLKNIPAKKMNIVASSATARPLGSRTNTTASDAQGGGDASSTKRPLTVHPAKVRHGTAAATSGGGSAMAATVRRATSSAAAAARHQQASSKDPQARFQIIPDKTGVKISPLYRLDAQDYRRARYKLKSTSRPLSFW